MCVREDSMHHGVCLYIIFLLQANIEFKGESSTGCVAAAPERKYEFAPHKIYYVLRPHHVS